MRWTQRFTIHQLSFMPRLFPVNCYLVEEDEELTLVDGALPYSAKAIQRVADRIGKPIRNIILTHAHSDHIGALDTLKRALPNASFLISERDARLLEGDRSLLPGEADVPVRPTFPFPAFATWHAPTALESARKLLKAEPVLLAVGHGDMIERPREAMEQAIGRASGRKERFA